MDLRKEFKDINLNETEDSKQPLVDEAHVESEKIVSDLETKLAQLRNQAPEVVEEVEEVEEFEDENEKTLYEQVQPFILPIALTLFAIIFAGMFLYFFSKSRVEQTAQAIVNQGVPEQVYYPPEPVPVVIKEEPLVCEEPQVLNETGDACIDLEPEPEPEPQKPAFQNGQTLEMNVKFSYDKYNYDNFPRGIYSLEAQDFEGEYDGFKVAPTNRAYANDYFFGVDRYTVSLIGSCSYVIDDAKILIENANLKDKTFSGNVVKVIEASKPRVDCGNTGSGYNDEDGN